MDQTERSESLWEAGSDPGHFAPLQQDRRADLCVVGAGIAGITTALLAAREGMDVVVLERAEVGGGETSQTSAHLSSVMDEGFDRLISMHGEANAGLIWRSHASAIDRIERFVVEDGIECGYRRLPGYLFAGSGAEETLEREFQASITVGIIDPQAKSTLSTASGEVKAVRYGDQAAFHPLRYLAGLTRLAADAGVRIHTHSAVTAPPAAHDGAIRIRTASATVTASNCLLATNYPTANWLGVLPKLAAYRSYVVALELGDADVPDALIWDVADPYHYLRLASDATGRRLLLVGGGDHRTGQPGGGPATFDELERWAKSLFGGLGDVAFRWSGQVLEPSDGIALIGRQPNQESLFVITGDSGQGLTHGTLGATIIVDLLAGRDNPYASLYDPGRLAIGEPLATAKENLSTARQYADLIFREDVSSEEDIAPGTGAILRDGVRPVAVYRDEQGGLHRRSAICTHLGCVVRWNVTEASWDCPCHGSRFAPDGSVLTGPAMTPLKPAHD